MAGPAPCSWGGALALRACALYKSPGTRGPELETGLNLRKTMHALVAALTSAACAGFGEEAAAQEQTPPQFSGIVLVEAMAMRGLECGLLRPWQAAALSAQTVDAARDWSAAQREQLSVETAARAQETQCDDEGMNAWIEAAQRGFESEMLSNFIVTYAALARMEPQPALFAQASQLDDHAGSLAAIEAKLAALEAGGGTPEGGGPWPDFIARQTARVEQTVRAYENAEGAQNYPRARVEGFIAASVQVTELWLAESAVPSGE
jgi:hypothetical protein